MKEFRDRIAVITGASSGIGLGIARYCAQEGMRVVMAGINYDNLKQAEIELKTLGAETLCIQTDVSKREDVEELAKRTQEAFGEIHFLVNNAGVGAGSSIWESTWSDWEWVMNVNLWGVIYGLKVFVPIMLAQNTPGYIVNVSSIAGLMPSHISAPYQVTKNAVVALTESLYHTLKQQEAQIGASVFCPGNVRKTRILDGERNRPEEHRNETREMSPEEIEMLEAFRKRIDAGLSVQEAVEILFEGIREKRLYINTHPELKSIVQDRMNKIVRSFDVIRTAQ